MNHRRADVRAAVFQRQRSQGHLRAVTVTVGLAGVVTAGAVAAILPGSTHAAASSATAARPASASGGSARPAAPPPTRHRPAPPPPPRPGPRPPGVTATTTPRPVPRGPRAPPRPLPSRLRRRPRRRRRPCPAGPDRAPVTGRPLPQPRSADGIRLGPALGAAPGRSRLPRPGVITPHPGQQPAGHHGGHHAEHPAGPGRELRPAESRGRRPPRRHRAAGRPGSRRR